MPIQSSLDCQNEGKAAKILYMQTPLILFKKHASKHLGISREFAECLALKKRLNIRSFDLFNIFDHSLIPILPFIPFHSFDTQ